MLLARVAHFNDVFDLCLITSCFAVRPKGQRWKRAVDSLKEEVSQTQSAKVALIDAACAECSVAAVTQSAGMRFRTQPQVCLFPTSVREKSKHLRAQWMLLAPRPPLSSTKAVCFPPRPLRQAALLPLLTQVTNQGWTTSVTEKLFSKGIRFFFVFFLPFFTWALYSAERRLLFCRWWLQWRTGALFTFRSGGKNPKWRSGETEEEGAHIAACTAAAVCGADRESLLGFAVYYFFFSQA